MKIILTLNGLDCANCANKIIEQIQNTPGIKKAQLNFVTKQLKYETDIDKKTSINIITDIVTSIENDVKVQEFSSVNHGHEEEKNDILRIIFALILFVASLLIQNKYMSFYAVAASYIIVGYDVVFKAFKNILKGKALDESFLMTIATIGAFYIGQYTEGVAVMLFYQIGEYFQHLAVKRSRNSIARLMDIRPDYANLKTGNTITKVHPDEVNTGDVIVVKAGERIPLDGVILNGVSTLDTSALTGESIPRVVKPDDEVLSGSINIQGMIEVIATKEYSNSTVAKILDLVENASEKKAKTEAFITRFAKVYTPIVVAVAAVIAVFPPLIIPSQIFSDWLYRALIFLVVSCPCALVISVPLGFFGGIGGASRRGILIKGANSLENLSKIGTIAFDKTGTLTNGKFTVSKVVATGTDEDKLLETIAEIEGYSNHPVSRAIIEYYNKPLDKNSVSELKEYMGEGIVAKHNGDKVIIGNKKLFLNNKLAVPEVDSPGTIIHTAINNRYAGYIVVSDEIKPGVRQAIKSLKQLSISDIAMLTGDKKQVADIVSNTLGIKNVFSELLPQDKVTVIEELLAKKRADSTVAFVGDGINDAPVITRADVGIAMGGVGSDSAIEAADVVLMTDELGKIPLAIKIARKTIRIIKQNIFFALFVKFLVLLLAVLGMSTMWMAVFADVGVSLIAIMNALRALNSGK